MEPPPDHQHHNRGYPTMDPENMAREALALLERDMRLYDVQVAVAHGPVASMLYARIWYWVAKNLLAGRNVDEDGIAWTYDTIEEMAKRMIFPSVNTIQRALKELKDAGLILSKARPPSVEQVALVYGAIQPMGKSLRHRRHQIGVIDDGNMHHR